MAKSAKFDQTFPVLRLSGWHPATFSLEILDWNWQSLEFFGWDLVIQQDLALHSEGLGKVTLASVAVGDHEPKSQCCLRFQVGSLGVIFGVITGNRRYEWRSCHHRTDGIDLHPVIWFQSTNTWTTNPDMCGMGGKLQSTSATYCNFRIRALVIICPPGPSLTAQLGKVKPSPFDARLLL